MKIWALISPFILMVMSGVFLSIIMLQKQPIVTYQFPVTTNEFSIEKSLEKAKHFNKKETNVSLTSEECLGLVIFYEAGSQPLESKLGVAFVVENRRIHKIFADTYCGVVYEPSQFYTMKKYRPFRIDDNEWNQYTEALELADNLINAGGFTIHEQPAKDALYFHSLAKYSDWEYASKHQFIKTVGRLHFSK